MHANLVDNYRVCEVNFLFDVVHVYSSHASWRFGLGDGRRRVSTHFIL